MSIHQAASAISPAAPDQKSSGLGSDESFPPADPPIDLTILMPCLNEAETLATCIEMAREFLGRSGVVGEILVADNGSTDGSPELAASHGARVVSVSQKGYGAALLGGIAAARGRFIIMADADASYDFGALELFVERLRAGAQLVIGNRFRGGIAPGAMPPLHRYLGNPLLTGIGRLLFAPAIGDFHCGLRGFDRAAMLALELSTTGMEFASEMVVKASLAGLRIEEVPTTLKPAGRSRAPHLRSWRDGWRHLRFLLLYSPDWLFIYPGLAAMLLFVPLMLRLTAGPLTLGAVHFDVHTLLIAGVGVVLGSQCVTFGLLARDFTAQAGLLPPNRRLASFLEHLPLEAVLLVSLGLVLVGAGGVVTALARWGQLDFGDVAGTGMMRVVVPSVTAMAVGVQIGLAGFFRSILLLLKRRS